MHFVIHVLLSVRTHDVVVMGRQSQPVLNIASLDGMELMSQHFVHRTACRDGAVMGDVFVQECSRAIAVSGMLT